MIAAESSLSRRAFLSTTAITASYVWIPKPVKGYSAAELRAGGTRPLAPGTEAPGTVPAAPGTEAHGTWHVAPGTSKWDLDTPALCVDLDALEANIAKMQAAVTKNGIATRPHAKTHKCAAIARLQLAAGAIGICTAKLSEAEALFAHGIEKICMTTSNPSPRKIRRAMQLRKWNAHFIQAVDEEQNARDLSAAAKEAGVSADVVIDVAVGTRSGIPPGDGAVALAQLIDKLPNLKLRGLLGC